MHRIHPGFALCVLAALASPAAVAQAYPAKPVRMIVGFPPGGGTDILARIVAQKLSDAWSQPVVVENRPGASATIAAGAVGQAPADGYTLSMGDAEREKYDRLVKRLGIKAE